MTLKRKHRILIATGGVLILFIIAAAGLWLWIGRPGDTELENWIGRYLVEVLEHHITPAISLGALDYRRPRTVLVKDVRLVSDDVPLLQIERLLLELAQVPRRDEPVVIQRIELNKPRLQFVSRRDGGLVGWSNFVRPKALHEPEAVPPGWRFSDALQMRNFTIDGGEVVYDPGTGEAMTLPGIDLRLDTPPAEGEPGWYRIAAKLSRKQLFDADINGRINVDDGRLDLQEFKLDAALDEKRYGIFPPNVQSALARHQVRGALAIALTGTTKFPEWTGTSAQLKADLSDGSFAYAGQQLDVRHAGVDARLAENELDANYQADLSDRGSVVADTHASGHISANLAGDRPVQFALDVHTDDVERWLRMLPPEALAQIQPRPARGKLTAHVEGTAPPSDLARGPFRIEAELGDAQLVLGDSRFDTRHMSIHASIQDAALDLRYEADLLGGSSSGSARIDLAKTRPPELSITLTGVDVAS
ncbi:MAG TPA: hypothetical protein VGM03_14030, partial [Phycisphaerae bacterium]